MPDKWVSIAVAAATLNVHPRTIERRIASGKVQTRRADDGMQQVFIDIPDTPSATADPLETVRELANDQVSLATGSASAIVRLAQADADRARSELSLVRDEALRIRNGARLAWSAVGLIAVAACVAVGISSHQMTWSHDQIHSLEEKVVEARRQTADALDESKAIHREAESAKLAGAEAAGRLAAYIEQSKAQNIVSDKRPSTQPSNRLIERIASIFSND